MICVSWFCLVINSCLKELFFNIDCKRILVLWIVVKNCFNLLVVIFKFFIEFIWICLNCLIYDVNLLLIIFFIFWIVFFVVEYIFCFIELRLVIFDWFFNCMFLIYFCKLENDEIILWILFCFFFIVMLVIIFIFLYKIWCLVR